MPELIPQLIQWTGADSLLRVECAPEVMEEIRLRVLAGYKSLPKTGAGVGGLLLGERAGSVVRVLGSVTLPCAYTFGPGFALTPHEKSEGRELVREQAPLEAVGWYFSRTRGDLSLLDADAALGRDLFPQFTPLTLVMKPAPDAPVKAALYAPGAAGELIRTAERELSLAPPPQAPQLALVLAPKPVRLPLETLPALPPMEPEDESAYGALPGSVTPRSWTRLITAVAVLAVAFAVFEAQSIWLNETPVQPTSAAR